MQSYIAAIKPRIGYGISARVSDVDPEIVEVRMGLDGEQVVAATTLTTDELDVLILILQGARRAAKV